MTVLRHVPLFTSAATSGNGLITLWPQAGGGRPVDRIASVHFGPARNAAGY